MFGVLGWIVFGLVVGIVAKFLMPGHCRRRLRRLQVVASRVCHRVPSLAVIICRADERR